MKQQTLIGFEKHAKTTRRAQWLADIDKMISWWFNLSDPAAEEELYDSVAMRSFVAICWRRTNWGRSC